MAKIKFSYVNYSGVRPMTEDAGKYTAALDALFGKPDYSHIVRDTTATIGITAAEMAAVLEAYDRGIDTLDGTTRTALEAVLAKLKYELWP